MIVADTDVLIDALHGEDPQGRVAAALRSGALATTSITAFELLSGARSEAAQEAVRLLLDAVQVVPLDREAAARAAVVRQQLERTGKAIGMADYLIAGICLDRGASLLTRNQGHFDRVEGLELA